jgi:hypothetical protein
VVAPLICNALIEEAYKTVVLICIVLRDVAMMSPKSINPKLDPNERESTVKEEIVAFFAVKLCVVSVEIEVLRPKSVEKDETDEI